MTGLGWKHVLLALGCIVLVVIAIQATGVAPRDAVSQFVEGSLVGPAAWRKTLEETVPLMIAGLAVFLALKAGLFNIGADGQFVVGAAAAAAVVIRIPGPLGVLLALLASLLGGALWAFPAGWIRAYRGGHEVISSIMLNYIAGFLSMWLVSGPLKDPSQQSATTILFPRTSWVPFLVDQPPFQVSFAIIAGLVGVVILAFWLKSTVAGYELRATGANPSAAETAGVAVKVVTLRAMTASGAIAGLAGAFFLLGHEHRYHSEFSPGYGFDALGVALLSGGSAWGLIPASFLFAVLNAGTSAVQLTGVPKGLSGILLGILIILFASVRYRRQSTGIA